MEIVHTRVTLSYRECLHQMCILITRRIRAEGVSDNATSNKSKVYLSSNDKFDTRFQIISTVENVGSILIL